MSSKPGAGHVEKCGQKPSFAEIIRTQDNELTKVMNKEDRTEFNKAVGLAAHDAGVGACAYLRRIFERMIYRRYEEHKTRNSWVDEEFFKLRMNEKINFLKEYLPSLLVKNAATYGILSEGLHQLSEDDCTTLFPMLREGTLLIAQQDKAQKERIAREKEFSKSVSGYKPKSGKT